jgi:acyl carrier protein
MCTCRIASPLRTLSQAGYAAGSAFQDSLAHYRRRHHLPAVTIDLGPMLDVGVIKEGTTVANFSALGAVWMKEADLHAIVTTCISGDRNSHFVPPQICTGLSSGGMLQVSQSEAPLHFERPFFAHLEVLGTADKVAGEATVASLDKVSQLVGQLTAAPSMDVAQALVVEALRCGLSEIIGCAADDVDPSKPLHEHGIDSLMSTRLSGWISKKLKAEVGFLDISNAESLHEVAWGIVKTSEMVPKGLQ